MRSQTQVHGSVVEPIAIPVINLYTRLRVKDQPVHVLDSLAASTATVGILGVLTERRNPPRRKLAKEGQCGVVHQHHPSLKRKLYHGQPSPPLDASSSGIIANALSVSPANACRFGPEATCAGEYPPRFHV